MLTGLPDGTWYVKVYDGGVPGTTISIDAGAPQATTTVHGVADGSAVEIEHPLPVRRADSFLAPG